MNKSEKVVFINGRFLTQQITGVQRYSREIISAIDSLIDNGEIKLPSNLNLICLTPKQPINEPGWKNIKIMKFGKFKDNLWEQIDLPFFVKNKPLFSPANIAPLLAGNQIATFHDTSVYALPEVYSFLFRLKYRIIFKLVGKKAKRIITISQFSKNELEKYCGIESKKMDVISHGHEHLLTLVPDFSIIEKHSLKSKPFFLMVGSKSRHKNASIVFEANKLLDKDKINIVVAGGSYSKVFQKSDELSEKNVIQVGYVSDQELAALYQNAYCFIFPSLYEGFGLPVLESLSFGCPVLCSNAASLAEFGGDLVTYFNPLDSAQLAQLMEKMITDSKKEEVNFEKLQSQYSWKTAAMKTWQVLNQYFD